MNMFRQAVHESLRQLGINPPKAIMAILVIGFSIFLVSEFLGPQASKVAVTVVPSLENSDPTNGSVPGWQLWLIQSIAWLGAFAVVFTLLLIWNAFRCVRVERATTANLRILADSADSADDQIKLVFRNSFSNPWYGISKCYAFGSVVRQYPTHDVDIVVQFDSSEENEVRNYRKRLRGIEKSFGEMFGLPIHVQTFLSTEADGCKASWTKREITNV